MKNIICSVLVLLSIVSCSTGYSDPSISSVDELQNYMVGKTVKSVSKNGKTYQIIFTDDTVLSIKEPKHSISFYKFAL